MSASSMLSGGSRYVRSMSKSFSLPSTSSTGPPVMLRVAMVDQTYDGLQSIFAGRRLLLSFHGV